MANDDDGRKAPWSSWFVPGDSRRIEERKLSRPDNGRPSTVEEQPNASPPKQDFHPFIAFKHFVDDSFAAITDFSDNLAELRQAAQDRQAVYQSMNDAAYERWAGPPGSRAYGLGERGGKDFYAVKLHHEDAILTAQLLMKLSEEQNRHVDMHKITALFDDPEFNPWHVIEKTSPWPFYSRNHGCGRGDPVRMVPSATQWLSINWFKHSPYSPLSLEADPVLAKYDTKWRHAFEDLLEAALDKPMTSQEKFGYRGSLTGKVSTWRGPGLDWMLSLQCRGILPPQLPHMYKSHRDALANFFTNECFWSVANSRWSGEWGAIAPEEHPGSYLMMADEYNQLIEEIETPTPQDGTGSPYGELTQEERVDRQFLLKELNERRERDSKRRCPWGRFDDEEEPAWTGECPDELGRAVGEAVRQSQEPDNELEMYERLLNDLSEDSLQRTNKSQSSAGRCPDDLGRAVGDAARQEAARAFADEENGLADDSSEAYDFEKFLASDDEVAKRVRQLVEQERLMLQRELVEMQQKRDSMSSHPETTDSSEASCSSYPLYDASGTPIEDLYRELEGLIDDNGGLSIAIEDLNDKAEVLMMFIRELDEQVRELKQARAESQTHADQKCSPQTPQILEQEARQPAIAFTPTQPTNERPQVLSTLTTTQTTRLPDGSIKTTVVLKRRFADGLEEIQESTQTSFDEAAASSAGGQDSSKKGWFWS